MGNLALVGHQYCRLHNLGKQADQFLDLYIRAAWGRRTAAMEIPFRAAFSGSLEVSSRAGVGAGAGTYQGECHGQYAGAVVGCKGAKVGG